MDIDADFLLSGSAHVYYGLIGIMGAALFLLFRESVLALVLIIAFAFGIFVDLWAHGYTH